MTTTSLSLPTRTVTDDTLKNILKELRLLRSEVQLLLPQEELKDYTNPDRIQQSYQNALRTHPPISV